MTIFMKTNFSHKTNSLLLINERKKHQLSLNDFIKRHIDREKNTNHTSKLEDKVDDLVVLRQQQQ